MKRGTNHTWKILRYKGDIALYAKCKCGFQYQCSNSMEQKIETLYYYCPHCGAKKKWITDIIKVGFSK